MNAERRGRITRLKSRLEEIQSELETVQDDIRALAEEEREAFENLPESLQDGDKGQAMDRAADCLESAAEECGDLASAVSSLEEAAE